MNPEKLHDALNLLDEDLILPTEQLRRRKALQWRRLAALAACLTVVCLLGVAGYRLSQENGSAESAQENALAMEMAPEAEHTVSDSDSLLVEENDGPEDAAIAVVETNTLLVCVEQVEKDRFTAKVLQSGGGYAKGDVLTVMLTASTCLVEGDTACSVPDAGRVFSVGAALAVQYKPSQDVHTVYAENIFFGE